MALIMKVMYFLFEGFDTANGTNHLALTTMRTFLESGIEVYLVTSHSKGLFPDIPESICKRKGFSYSVIRRNKVEKKKFVQRYLDGMVYAIKACRKWKKERGSIDAVVLQSMPTAFFSVVLLQMYMKKPIIFNSFDMFPNGPYLFGAITNKVVYTILVLMQKYVYKSSSKIVVISEDMKQSYLQIGIKESKLEVLPNWYDSSMIREIEDNNNQFIKNYNIDRKKFIVQYAGNFGYTFNYQAVVEVAKLLTSYPEIEFHMIGTGGFESEFKRAVKEAGLNNVRFFPWQDMSIINDVYSSCDLEIIPLSYGVIWTSFPSKCTLLMACARTFLCMCEKKSHFYRFVNESNVGVCTSEDDYTDAAKHILRLSKDKIELGVMKKNAKKCGEKYFSSDVNAQKYVYVFKELVKE